MAKLSIATYNITELIMLTASRTLFWHTRKWFVLNLIKLLDAHIVCLQEDFPLQMRFLVKHTHYASISYASKDFFNKERGAILYDQGRFTLLDSGQFSLSATPERRSKVADARYYQHCTWAKFQEKGAQRAFFVFNAHFPVPISDQSRVVIARAMSVHAKHLAQSAPFILCGDLNTWPSPWFYDALGKSFIDTFHLQPKAHQVEYNTRQEWPARKRKREKERLDYIFLSPALKKCFISYKILRNKVFFKGKYWPPSDHCPVRVELQLENT